MATPKPVRKKMASEGPKRSVAKPTAAQSAAAKKKAAIKKAAAEGPKRSTSKPSATAMASAKSKPKVVEAGVGNIPMTAARAGIALGKRFMGGSAKAGKGSEGPKKSAPKSNVKVATNRTELTSTKNHNNAIRAKIKEQMDIMKSSPSDAKIKAAAQQATKLASQLK